jgi:hypothetical protein
MSSETLALPLEKVVWRPTVSPWAIAATVSMAAFIEFWIPPLPTLPCHTSQEV